MKPRDVDLEAAVAKLSALQYYPSDTGARVAIKGLLARMVDRKDQLDWLVQTMIDRVGTWRGTIELRGVYCTRFKPADGVEANCIESPGFTALDSEYANALEFPKPLPEIEDSKRSRRLLTPGEIGKELVQ